MLHCLACTDTPYWSVGIGKDPSVDCLKFAQEYCQDDGLTLAAPYGEGKNYPEKHCCECGKGAEGKFTYIHEYENFKCGIDKISFCTN